jgi:hypothetical protein
MTSPSLITVRTSLQELKLRQTQDPDADELVRSYNLDDAPSPVRPATTQPYSLPTRATADAMTKIYFSTVHVAYPFISEETFYMTYPQIFNTVGDQTLTDAWKATICIVDIMIF